MEQFKQYIIDEYKESVKDTAAVEFKYTHNSTVKRDWKKNIPLKYNIIKVNIKFVDKDMDVLKTAMNESDYYKLV